MISPITARSPDRSLTPDRAIGLNPESIGFSASGDRGWRSKYRQGTANFL
ncbi:MAG: hypothetical protein LH628_11245 [Microcoleus sp. CAN_BIN18]|nr:hypothetical protein [Microcoleus sp. CAN_BIN18]